MNEAFITPRIKQLRSHGLVCDVHFLIMAHGPIYALIQKILGRGIDQEEKEEIIKDETAWTGFTYTLGLKDALHRRINPIDYRKQMCETIATTISSRIDFSKYDLIHCHIPYPEGYVGAILSRKHKIPLIITCHGSDIHTYPLQDPSVKAMTVSALTDAKKVIFVSDSLRQTALSLGYDGKNAAVIPNGVDTSHFTIKDREVKKAELGMSGKVVGYIGNLNEVKRADKLPEIFQKIRGKRKDVGFLVVGDGELRKSIVDRCKELKLNVKFTGMIPPSDIPNHINAMDVLLLPSRKEGFGCVILEAQACGVPVVGSDCGGIPEAIGEGGTIIPDGADFEGRFAKATVDALNRDWDRNALRSMALKMGWENTVKREIVIYSSLITK